MVQTESRPVIALLGVHGLKGRGLGEDDGCDFRRQGARRDDVDPLSQQGGQFVRETQEG